MGKFSFVRLAGLNVLCVVAAAHAQPATVGTNASFPAPSKSGSPVILHAPKGDLGKMGASMDIEQFTVDRSGKTVSFQLPNTNSTQVEQIKVAPTSLESNVPYRMHAEKVPNQDVVRLTDPRMEFLVKWNGAKDRVLTDQKFTALNAVVNKIPPKALSIPADLRQEIQSSTVSAIVDSTPNSPEQSLAVELYYLQEKSYTGDQQIPYSVFEKAGPTCLTACAIWAKGSPNPHGSGVLIGEKLVLTCAHNFAQIQGGALQCDAVFNFKDEVQNRGATFTIAQEFYKSNTLDFCLLKLGDEVTNTNFQLPVAAKLGTRPELARNEGIYVAGHPQGRPLSVALNGQVVYPFWIENDQSMKKLVQWAVLRMFSSQAEYEANRDNFLPLVTQFFTGSYKPDIGSSFRFRPLGFPAIGADPDTKQGDSGSPVFDIKRNSVIGLLRGALNSDGGGDLPGGANHAYFELVIPISEIVRELNDKKPTWKTDFNVQSL